MAFAAKCRELLITLKETTTVVFWGDFCARMTGQPFRNGSEIGIQLFRRAFLPMIGTGSLDPTAHLLELGAAEIARAPRFFQEAGNPFRRAEAGQIRCAGFVILGFFTVGVARGTVLLEEFFAPGQRISSQKLDGTIGWYARVGQRDGSGCQVVCQGKLVLKLLGAGSWRFVLSRHLVLDPRSQPGGNPIGGESISLVLFFVFNKCLIGLPG